MFDSGVIKIRDAARTFIAVKGSNKPGTLFNPARSGVIKTGYNLLLLYPVSALNPIEKP